MFRLHLNGSTLIAAAIGLSLTSPLLAHDTGTTHGAGYSDAPAAHEGHREHADTAEHPANGANYVLGDLTVDTPWSRATPPTANVAAGYMMIRNEGDAAARLVGASSPASGRVEIHTMEIVNDVMTMEHVPDGLEIPSGGEVSLAPGGLHLMLIDLNEPLAEGDAVPVTLEFESGMLDVELAVHSMGARDAHSGH